MSEIEWYLDELFDQLAGTGTGTGTGTGAAGRRALMEAEYHLRTASADAMARGLPEDRAEHEAVSRFGPPALVARKMRSAQGAGRLNRAVSTGWLLAGLAGCGLGAAYLVAVWWHTWQTPDCTVALAYGCYTTGMLVTRVTAAMTIALPVPRCCSAAGSPSGTQHWHPLAADSRCGRGDEAIQVQARGATAGLGSGRSLGQQLG